jgi:hypothetical protein
MLYGLISSWLANSAYLPLKRQAEAMIDMYLDGLRGGNISRAARVPGKLRARRRRARRS